MPESHEFAPRAMSRSMTIASSVLLVAGSLLLAGCSGASSLESELIAAVEVSDGSLVISALPSVSGSSFLIVCPYESADSVDDRLGFTWADAPDYSQSDDRQSLVIIDGGRVVTHLVLARDRVDFCSGEPWRPLLTDMELLVSPSSTPIAVTLPG